MYKCEGQHHGRMVKMYVRKVTCSISIAKEIFSWFRDQISGANRTINYRTTQPNLVTAIVVVTN